jgi:hypothetical protein
VSGYGTLPIGHLLPEGRIVGRTLTAYEVVTPNDHVRFVGFAHVHKLAPVEPLVRFDG